VELQPSGRLLWTPTETQTLWGAVTHAVRTPSDVERDFFLSGFIGALPNPQGGQPIPFFARFNANRNFQSEKLNGYELGYRRLLGKQLYVDVAGFFNQYYDLFSEDIVGPISLENSFENIPGPTHFVLPAQFGNGVEGSTTGGEIAPQWKVTSFWTLKGSYAFLHMVIKPSPGSLDVGSSARVAGTSPQHQVVAQSQLDLPKHLTFDFSYRYVSSLAGLQIPSYSTGDARLGWTLAWHFEFSVVGTNLFQPNHVEFASDPGPNVAIRRSVYAKLVWTSRVEQ
jgi:iron complex outermembrane receptor protein